MKIIICLVSALLLSFGFAQQEPAKMTSKEQETAKKEIKEVVNLIIQGLEKLDAEAVCQPYSKNSDFILFTVYGTMFDYQRAKNEHAAWFKTLSSMKVTIIKEEFRFLPDSTVIYPWLGKFKITLQTGEQVTDNLGITMIFRKINNQWIVIYQQTSQVPPVHVRPKE
jgi:ketosteroid isomerase-like protein